MIYDKTYDNIQKIMIGKGDVYITGWLLDYHYLKENCILTAIDLSKKQGVDANPKAIQENHFTGNLDRKADTAILKVF